MPTVIDKVTDWVRGRLATNSATSASVTSGTIWTAWNEDYTSCTLSVAPSATTSSTEVWSLWNGVYSTTRSATTTGGLSTDLIWTAWNATYVRPVPERDRAWASSREPSPEELQRRLQLQQEREQRELSAQQARDRAETLLRNHLTPEQRESLEQRGCFELEVHSRDGSSKRYRINRGRAGNVKLLGPNGQPVQSFCIHPSEQVPDADTMLAQKLLLETREEDFLRIANATGVR